MTKWPLGHLHGPITSLMIHMLEHCSKGGSSTLNFNTKANFPRMALSCVPSS